MPSDARSIALSRDGIGLVPEWLLSLESTIRTPPRGFDLSPPRKQSGSTMICQWLGMDQGQTTGPQSVGQDTFSAALFAGAQPIQ
jgi:hypothetical protein